MGRRRGVLDAAQSTGAGTVPGGDLCQRRPRILRRKYSTSGDDDPIFVSDPARILRLLENPRAIARDIFFGEVPLRETVYDPVLQDFLVYLGVRFSQRSGGALKIGTVDRTGASFAYNDF